MTVQSERMRLADAAWLHMDRAENPMVINGIFELQGRMSIEAVQRLLQERLLRFDRFGQKIVDPESARPRWVDDPDFTVERHVRAEHALDDDAEIPDAIAPLISSPLPLDRPPWVIHVFELPEDRTLLLCRLHHSIADGMALLRVLLGLSDEHAEEGHADGAKRSAWKRLGRGAWTLVRRPLKNARRGTDYATSAARLILRRPDPRTALRGLLGAQKRTAWTRPIELETVKRIGKARGATINDVLTAALSGALGRYVRSQGDRAPTIRAMVPVDLRPRDRPAGLGNLFGLVMLRLPLEVDDPLERIAETKRRMDHLKGAEEAVAAYGLLSVLGLFNRFMEAPFIRFFAAKVSAVLTNVPGPRQRLHLLGHEVRRMMFWVPQTGHIALGISILSYAGEVSVGIMTDTAVIPEPDRITDAFEEEVEVMRHRVLGPENTNNRGQAPEYQ